MKKEQLLSDTLSNEEEKQYNDKAIEIAERLKLVKVTPYIGIDPVSKERVVAYIQEPSYLQKLYILDKMSMGGPFKAAEELRDSLTLKDESDPRTYSEMPIYDSFKLGVLGVCVTIVEVVANALKKK